MISIKRVLDCTPIEPGEIRVAYENQDGVASVVKCDNPKQYRIVEPLGRINIDDIKYVQSDKKFVEILKERIQQILGYGDFTVCVDDDIVDRLSNLDKY